MGLVEDIRPFRMMLLHLALCCYRVHKFLVTELVINPMRNGQGEGDSGIARVFKTL